MVEALLDGRFVPTVVTHTYPRRCVWCQRDIIAGTARVANLGIRDGANLHHRCAREAQQTAEQLR